MSLRVLIVDDEAPARRRLVQLLEDIAVDLPTTVVAEAKDGQQALEWLAEGEADVALVDIRMPRVDGLQLALHLMQQPQAPAVIFVTAYDQYAVKAFDLAATDYLLKPVKAERLRTALARVRANPERSVSSARAALDQLAPQGRNALRCLERGRVVLIPITDVIYLRAELKYVTVRTLSGEHLLEESLTQLETEFGERFVRAHRNCLVARSALIGYEREGGEAESEGRWLLSLRGLEEKIPVSRRQWPLVKSLFKA
ncbi:MAG TPA: LytTR family DNA-binding domain-containing protein [Rhodocyclaceae bacterium]|nr:LytTR family DNA-binding domain-containing protein [Rhodocyclaceae bacterium]